MHRDDGKHFGQRLREARVSAGLSQSELEDISGIPKARLSRYENGHVEPSIQTLARLSSALNVSEASLLGDQRAILEDFFNTLYDRGVRITSSDQGIHLAHAIADVLLTLNPPDIEEEHPAAGSFDGIEHAAAAPAVV